MNVYEYLKIVEEQIRQKSIAPQLLDELQQHIEEQAEAYLENGLSTEEAFAKAVADMGDPVETGVQLDLVHQPHMDKKLLFIILGCFLLTTAVLFVNSRESLEARHIIWWGLSLCCFFSITFSKYKGDYEKHPFQMWCIFEILAVFGTLGFLSGRSSSIRNIAFAQGAFNASLMGFSIICYHYRNGARKELCKLAGLVLYTCGMTLLLGSFSYTYMILLAHIVILTVGIVRGWYKVPVKKMLIAIWGIPLILSPAVLFCLYQNLHKQNWPINYNQHLYSAAALLLLILLCRMFVDIRRLTNQFCRIICIGIFCAFLITYLQSLISLLGYGPAQNIHFPLFSPNVSAEIYYYCLMAASFLQLHKQDRVIPCQKPKLP